STYDHRVIQGAGSGEFLRTVHNLLLGEDDFYDEIFVNLRIPTTPIRWAPDVQVNPEDEVGKAARIQQLIHSYRVRGTNGSAAEFGQLYQLRDRKSTRLNSSHVSISYAVFC